MFTVYSENDRGSTLISNLFIDQYMKDANDAQKKYCALSAIGRAAV